MARGPTLTRRGTIYKKRHTSREKAHSTRGGTGYKKRHSGVDCSLVVASQRREIGCPYIQYPRTQRRHSRYKSANQGCILALGRTTQNVESVIKQYDSLGAMIFRSVSVETPFPCDNMGRQWWEFTVNIGNMHVRYF